jgi:hypothetical protein
MKNSFLIFFILCFCCLIFSAKTDDASKKERDFERYEQTLQTLKNTYLSSIHDISQDCLKFKLFYQCKLVLEMGLKIDFKDMKLIEEYQKIIQYLKDLKEKKIELPSLSPKTYKKNLKSIQNKIKKLNDKTVNGYVKLAKWCSRSEVSSNTQNIYDQALKINPENERLRSSLGHQFIFPFGWLTREQMKEYHNGYIPINNTWLKKKDLIKTSEKYSTWENAWELRTAHFLIRSDVPFKVLMETANLLEKHYDRFYEDMGTEMGLGIQRDLLFYYFAKASDYQKHALNECAPALSDRPGYCTSLCPHSEFKKYKVKDRQPTSHFYYNPESNRTILHEAIHHFLFAIPIQGSDSHYNFLIEGIASYYEPPEKGQTMNQKLETCRELVFDKKFVPLNEFMPMDAEEFQSGDIYEHYAQAVGLIHFFMNAKKKIYRKDFVRLIYQRHAYSINKNAFQEIFGKAPKAFEKDWIRYIRRMNKQ